MSQWVKIQFRSWVWLGLLVLLLVQPGASLAQSNLDVIVEGNFSAIDAVAWSLDNSTFVFLNRGLQPDPVSLVVKADQPIWKSYNVETGVLSEDLFRYPLQPDLTPDEMVTFAPLDFVLPSPSGNLLAYSSLNEAERPVLTFANRITGQVLQTALWINGDETFFKFMGGLEGYWSAEGDAFFYPQRSPYSEAVGYLQIRINPSDMASTQFHEFFSQTVEGKIYITYDSLEDIAFDMSDNGDQVLLLARERSLDGARNPTRNHILFPVIWYPESPESNRRITAVAGADICNAAFTPDSQGVTFLLRDGRVVVYRLVTNEIIELPVELPANCRLFSVFSYDGAWVALRESRSKLRFLNLGTIDTQNIAPMQPPIANAGPDITLIDTDGDGLAEWALTDNGSLDPDGEIVSYGWSIGQAELPGGELPFSVGTITITLTVTDNDGLQSVDEVQVTVEPASLTPAPQTP